MHETKGGGKMPEKLKKIELDFGSIIEFKKKFIQAGITQFGSGCAGYQ